MPPDGVLDKVVELPLHITTLPLVLIVGLGFTFTAAVADELLQLLASVTVTEYVMGDVGLAIGL